MRNLRALTAIIGGAIALAAIILLGWSQSRDADAEAGPDSLPPRSLSTDEGSWMSAGTRQAPDSRCAYLSTDEVGAALGGIFEVPPGQGNGILEVPPGEDSTRCSFRSLGHQAGVYTMVSIQLRPEVTLPTAGTRLTFAGREARWLSNGLWTCSGSGVVYLEVTSHIPEDAGRAAAERLMSLVLPRIRWDVVYDQLFPDEASVPFGGATLRCPA